MATLVQKSPRLALLLNNFSVPGSVKLTAGRRNVYYCFTKQLCAPIPNKPKYVTAQEALECLKSGNLVFVQGAAATPNVLLEAMTERGKSANLKDITVCHIHTEGPASYAQPENALERTVLLRFGVRYKETNLSRMVFLDIFRSCSLFMGANVRKSVAEGTADCVPIFLCEIPKLFHKGIYKPDISLIHVSPPDEHGYCSLGTSVDCVRSALVNSKITIAQINPNMPRTFGDGIIHSSHIDYAVNVDSPLPVHGGKPPSEVESKIGKLIAENLVENGATLQMGIGNIPDAVLASLTNHKDLGVHTEMFSAGVIDLLEKGCITNNMKTTHRGKIVSSFLIGPKKLYDFVNNNPSVEMLEVDYTNSVFVIAQQPKMTAINSCIEVDLTGQVVSDSIGTRMYSGFGGQVDFIRGAAEAHDGKGKPILAFPSSAKGISKITPYIKQGAGVVTTRAHVHYLVTEYGIAELFGKSLRQRAHALIQIAHPDHRESLEKAAFERLKTMPSP